MPYSSGIITIGLASSDYLTVDAAIADYTGGIVGLSGDLTWVIEADTTWTSNFNLYDHNGFTFLITSKTHHYGNVNAGFYITIDAAVNVYVAVATLGFTIIEKVKITGAAYSNLYLLNQSSVSTRHPANVVIRDNIFIGIVVWMIQDEVLFVRYLVYNNLLINSILRYDYTYGTTPHVCDTSIFENNSIGYEGAAGSSRVIMNGGGGGVSKANLILRNNAIRMAVGGFGSEGFQLINQGIKKPIAYNNAATNDTAITPIGGTWDLLSSGNVGGILDSEFESLVASSADFMRLQKIDAIFVVSGNPRKGTAPLPVKFEHSVRFDGGSKVLYKGGVVPSLSSVDLAGEAYGKFGHYPIGCYNAQANPLRDYWEE